jgi:carbonic anhydrase
LPALPEFEPPLPPEVRLARAVESNVHWTVHQILNTRQAHLAEGRIKLIGAIYEIESGHVRFLSSE